MQTFGLEISKRYKEGSKREIPKTGNPANGVKNVY